MFNFLKNCQNIFQRGASLYILAIYMISNVKVLNFSTPLSTITPVCLLDNTYLNGYEVVPHCGCGPPNILTVNLVYLPDSSGKLKTSSLASLVLAQ